MKRYNSEEPGYSLFDFTTAGGQLAFGEATLAPLAATANTPEAPRSTSKKGFSPYRNFFKRALDVAAVVASAPFTLPVIGLCTLALCFEGGTPFYRQARLGRGGKTFSILKLRSMVKNADDVLEEYLASDPAMRAEWDSLQKLKKDPRVTRVGAFLRATSLDELPQLWNVLKGDMTLVGPRPMMPEQEEMYGDMRAYVAVRPGITGLWQVSARNGNTFRYRNEVDATYERSLSFVKDFKILLKTVGVVLRRTGC
jgi:lipopolysaccharide/colanic/teichoic acid biosynthesis glycosyltransferase